MARSVRWRSRWAVSRKWSSGRRATDFNANPDIDLGPFQAWDYGVSRLHAKLRFQDNTLTITDLDSVNHTYINGQRLHAHEVRVLRG